MKHFIYSLFVILLISSCSAKKQASNITGRTDDLYFTVNDVRIKSAEQPQPPGEAQVSEESNIQNNSAQKKDNNNNDGYYSNSYAKRLRYFGSSSRFNVTIAPVPLIPMNFNYGTNYGFSMLGPSRYGFNSIFSPYYRCYMPYYDPFYSYGWNGGGYNPYYSYSPYFYSPYFNYGYSGYYGYGNSYYGYGYNPFGMYRRNYIYNNYSNPDPKPNNSGRRTGSSSNIPNSNTSTNAPQNSTQNNNGNNSNNGWWNSGNSDRGGNGSSGNSGSSGGNSGSSGSSGSGSSGSGSSGGNSDRGSSGSNSGGARRR